GRRVARDLDPIDAEPDAGRHARARRPRDPGRRAARLHAADVGQGAVHHACLRSGRLRAGGDVRLPVREGLTRYRFAIFFTGTYSSKSGASLTRYWSPSESM